MTNHKTVSRVPWEDVLTPRGLVGDVARWIRDSSTMAQPKFALAGALTVCGSLLGRGVMDWTGQRTNVYTLAVGNTSAGKNDPIRCIQKLLLALDREILLCGEVTSDTALECLLLSFSSRLLLIDEVGHYVTSIKGAGPSNGHLRTVMPMLTKAWSAAGGALQGKARAPDTNGKLRPPRTIQEPNVAFYGTSAPDVLFDGMSEGDFGDGSIPRFISFISSDRPKADFKSDIEVPNELKESLEAALATFGLRREIYKADGENARLAFNKPILFERREESERVFQELENEKHEHLTQADLGDAPLYLWGKAVENARRVALTVAALAHPGAREIQQKDAVYAVRLIRLTIGEMVERVREDVATTKAERDKRVILRALRGCDRVTKSDLTRRTQGLSRHDREDALDDLMEAGSVEEVDGPGTGSKAVTYFRRIF